MGQNTNMFRTMEEEEWLPLTVLEHTELAADMGPKSC